MKTKEEIASGKAALLAEEAATKRKWCALEGHRWDLPQVNPFNNDIMDCLIICSRCNAHAKVTLTIEVPDTSPPTVVAPTAAVAAPVSVAPKK